MEPTNKPVGSLSALSLEEQKKERAKRFGIPVVDMSKKDLPGKKKKEAHGTETNKNKNKRTDTTTPAAASSNNKKAKVVSVAKEEPLLPKEEIEKRLKRAEKFGLSNENTDKLKAMLRKHRFNESAAAAVAAVP
jgi:SAP domain-containing ribonucleoprotein